MDSGVTVKMEQDSDHAYDDETDKEEEGDDTAENYTGNNTSTDSLITANTMLAFASSPTNKRAVSVSTSTSTETAAASPSTSSNYDVDQVIVEGCGMQAAVLNKQRSAKERQRDKQRKRKLERESIKQQKVTTESVINNYKNSDEMKAYIRAAHCP